MFDAGVFQFCHPGRSEAESRDLVRAERNRPPRHLQAFGGAAADRLSSN